jgi:CheY-like chemotaxis protein
MKKFDGSLSSRLSPPLSPLAIESSAIARIAAGAAYELAPPVSRALVNLRIFLNDPSPHVDAGEVSLVQRALASVEQIASTVHALHAFTTVEDTQHGVDVHEAVEVAIGLTSREIAAHAKLLRRYSPVRRVRGSSARITHALVNVLSNAAASIPPSAPADNAIEVATGMTADGHVFVEITDSGVGIGADDLPFIFDPFVSSWQGSGSHGLGLAAARAALVEIGGSIAVESTVGRGSRFRITLCRSESDEVPALPPHLRETLPERRVLCVAETTTDALRLGELVEESDVLVLFATWQDALDRLTLGESFDLVLCDRGGVGREAFQKQLVHVAPATVGKTFALTVRSSRSGVFTRASTASDGRSVGDGRR